MRNRTALVVIAACAIGVVPAHAGDLSLDGQIVFTDGSLPPLVIQDPKWVENLNADRLDGFDSSAFASTTEVEAMIEAAQRRYYLAWPTGGSDGDEVETTCASGFHAASLWEISDPSNLIYDGTQSNDVSNQLAVPYDQGAGPPAALPGWVLTSVADIDHGNCSGWTIDSTAGTGFTAMLPSLSDGSTARFPGTPWVVEERLCDASQGVWCIED